MKEFIKTKFFVGFVCFVFGYYFHLTINAINTQDRMTGFDRVQVDPNDFDHDRMLDAVKRMHQNSLSDHDELVPSEMNGDVEKKEDQNYVYYEIKNPKNENATLNVSIKDGMILITESSKAKSSDNFHFEQSSMHQFAIEAGLDEKKATIETLEDKIIVKIPRKKS